MFDRCIYFNVNALTRAVNRLWEDAYQGFGLSPAHAYLLRYVLANPGCTQKAIARAMELSESTVTRFVDVLAAKQLIARETASHDQRETLIHPTEKGLLLREGLDATGLALFTQMREILGAAQFDALVSGMCSAREEIGASRAPSGKAQRATR